MYEYMEKTGQVDLNERFDPKKAVLEFRNKTQHHPKINVSKAIDDLEDLTKAERMKKYKKDGEASEVDLREFQDEVGDIQDMKSKEQL